jgi:nitroimidazol reductase NimA-like FMN-containing flavoprotein (pyridoxamine 5'-phosphate oxidase superfamily)
MDANGGQLHVLDREHCLALMRSVPVGRVVYTDQALPAIVPVNFALDENNDVIIRTGPGSKMAAAVRGAVVAFETDDFDMNARTGWSVTIIGAAQPVRTPQEIARLARLRLRPWAPAAGDSFIRISSDHIFGRTIALPTDLALQSRAG